MKSRIDLHIHSSFSDGEDIEELIKKIKLADIETFAICDHDNIDAVNYLRNIDLRNIKYISGVEISSYYDNMGIHVLGYYIDKNIKAIEKLLKKINGRRIKRMKEILKKIKIRNGIKLTRCELEELLQGKNIGKKKLGKILVKNNLGKDYLEVRENYLKNLNCKTSYRAHIEKVCKAIKKAGGIPILAHPKEIELRYKVKLENIIKEMINSGIMGIEVYHSIHSLEDVKRYLEIAKKYNLLISGGSDYHKEKYQTLGLLMKEDYEIEYEKFTIIKE